MVEFTRPGTLSSHRGSEARNRLQSLSSPGASESHLEVLDLAENDLVELKELLDHSIKLLGADWNMAG